MAEYKAPPAGHIGWIDLTAPDVIEDPAGAVAALFQSAAK